MFVSGAAFGFSGIAEQARDQLKPYLPQLVPMLFRYQYDPNQKVQEAMTNIWRAVVADPKETVDRYFIPILNVRRIPHMECCFISMLTHSCLFSCTVQ